LTETEDVLYHMVEHVLEALSYSPIQRAIVACVLCGASCALLSVFVVLMKMPLIGVSMSHAAFAGAVLGMLMGFNPFFSGLVFCLVVAAALGPLSDRVEIAPENVLGIVFSFLMGIAFLGMGVLTQTKAGALNLMWGSILTLTFNDLAVLAVVTTVLSVFIILFFKEIRVVLFNRRLAQAGGVPERMIYYGLLFLTGAVVSSNLVTVGGLLIFALLVQPGATALQLTYDLKSFFCISVLAGIVACVLGLAMSYIFDIPSGASVVLMATLIFALSFVFSPKRRSSKNLERKTSYEMQVR